VASGQASVASVRRTAGFPARWKRDSVTSGTTSEAGAKPAQCGERPPSSANAKPPTAMGPSPGRVLAPSPTAAADSSRQRCASVAKRPGPAVSSTSASPSPASAARARSGCSNANQASPGRREQHATAVGSTSAASGSEQVASVRAPLRLARRTASETCAASRSRCSAARANDARPEVTRTG